MRTSRHAGGMRSLAIRASTLSSSTAAPSGRRYEKPDSFVPSRRMPCRSRYQRRRTPLVGIARRFCENGALLESPPPVLLLTTWQKRLLWITFLLVVFTRGYALSRSLWDWDEAQFAAAVDEYSVGRHHPHPPRFPLYILG